MTNIFLIKSIFFNWTCSIQAQGIYLLIKYAKKTSLSRFSNNFILLALNFMNPKCIFNSYFTIFLRYWAAFYIFFTYLSFIFFIFQFIYKSCFFTNLFSFFSISQCFFFFFMLLMNFFFNLNIFAIIVLFVNKFWHALLIFNYYISISWLLFKYVQIIQYGIFKINILLIKVLFLFCNLNLLSQ